MRKMFLTSAFSFPTLSFLHHQVAIIAGNFDLAEIIKVHKASDVGKLDLIAAAVYHQTVCVFPDLRGHCRSTKIR